VLCDLLDMAMDSKAVFAQRLGDLGLTEFKDEFDMRGWDSHGNFAFASTYVPGAADDARFVAQVVMPLLAAPDHVKVTAVRRLFYESYTIMVSDLKHRVERTDDEPIRKLPIAERAFRLIALQARLGPGVPVADESECSHALVDRMVQMYDENVLAYIDWSACTSRLEELAGVKHVKELKADSSGFVKEKSTEVRGVTDTSSELLIRYALTRRGLAMEMGQLLSYVEHEKMVAFLFREYMRLPPPGYGKVSIEQLRRADLEIFRQLQEQTRGGVKLMPDGRMPLDLVLPGILVSPRVAMLLMPLPASSGSKRQASGDADANPRQAKRHKAAKAKAAASAVSAGAGGKAGGKRATKSAALPAELVGMVATVGDKRVCFGFNMTAGCPESPTVEVGCKCSRGFHICCVPGCGGAHCKAKHV
jgi:hypothetical protein